jgi:hypothetical protein
MGCKAEGAAQGYTVLGGIVLLIYAIQQIAGAAGDLVNGMIDILIAVALLLIVILAFDASGFVNWKLQRSGLLLTLFGLFSIFIVSRNILLDIIAWLSSLPTLAGFMIFIAGLLIMVKG